MKRTTTVTVPAQPRVSSSPHTRADIAAQAIRRRLVILTVDGMRHEYDQTHRAVVSGPWLLITQQEFDSSGSRATPLTVSYREVAGWPDREVRRFFWEIVPEVPDYGSEN